jgi:hypothetical protein
LGMYVRFTDNKAVITMKSYLAEFILESGLDIVHEALPPPERIFSRWIQNRRLLTK